MASKPWMLMPKVSKLTGDEIILSYALYNHIFQTEYTSQTLKNFQPHTVTFQTYRLADEGRTKPVHSITVTVKELGSSGSALIHCSEELFYKFRETEFVTYGLYFDNIEDVAGVYQTGETLGYVPNSMMVQSASTMTRAVSVFTDFFFLISLVLYVGCASVLISFGVKAVKEKKYEIGVIKALGGKGGNLSLIFSVEIAIVGLLTCVFSWIGLYLFIGVANDVLVASLAELATSHVVRDMSFLVFNPTIMGLDCLGVMGFTLLSTAVPMLALRNIKPVNIIKAKE